MSVPETAAPARKGPGFVEFVTLVAMLMGITALAIDSLLPAFPMIGADLSVPHPNDLQLLLYVYMLGFASTQMVYGPLSDMFGRRPAMLSGLVLLMVGGVLAVFSPSFSLLIAARFVQGMGAAAARVISISIVRDRFGGNDMARVMSLITMVFIMVPVMGPAFGGLVLLFGPWRLLFVVMLALTVLLLIWFAIRMPETLHPEYRVPFTFRDLKRGALFCLTNRAAFGYSTSLALMFGALMGYIGSSQQILQGDVYGLGGMFPVAFGAFAIVMGLGSFLNALFVRRYGMRKLTHGAMIGYIAIAAAQVAVAHAYGGIPPFWLFAALLAANNFMFSLAMPNMNALCMEPLGAYAGIGSSLIGFYTTLLGALLGLVVGQSFDGTVVPLGLGFLVYSVLAFLVIVWTEKGKLFAPVPAGEAAGFSAGH